MRARCAPWGGILTHLAASSCCQQAALNSLACGPRRLEVTGEWQWLLDRLAGLHALRRHATLLAHLQWVLRPANATPTSDCLGLLTRQLEPLIQAKSAGELPQPEVRVVRCFPTGYPMLM